MPRVALATCQAFPDLDHEDRLLIPALAGLGIEAVPTVWDGGTVDWSAFDAVVLRETWDYTERLAEFADWLARVDAATLLLNPLSVVEWDTDKHYLADLAAAGAPIVPTLFLEPGQQAGDWEPPAGYDEYVVKPAVSAGSRDTIRYGVDGSRETAVAHVARLLEAGRSVMVQPYLPAVDTEGETAVLFIGEGYSHAIRKGPLLRRDVEGARVEGLFVQEQIDPRQPTPEQLSVARQVVAAIPGGFDPVLYARVDLIPGPDGSPLLLELELTEPSLFLSHDDAAPERLAAAIAARLGSRA